MDAYEFTRPQNNYLKSTSFRYPAYDARIIARNILERNMNKDLRSMPKYQDAYDTFIELTMSCNKREAVEQCQFWMANAMAYGKASQDVSWVFFFLAAYDLEKYLERDNEYED